MENRRENPLIDDDIESGRQSRMEYGYGNNGTNRDDKTGMCAWTTRSTIFIIFLIISIINLFVYIIRSSSKH